MTLLVIPCPGRCVLWELSGNAVQAPGRQPARFRAQRPHQPYSLYTATPDSGYRGVTVHSDCSLASHSSPKTIEAAGRPAENSSSTQFVIHSVRKNFLRCRLCGADTAGSSAKPNPGRWDRDSRQESGLQSGASHGPAGEIRPGQSHQRV